MYSNVMMYDVTIVPVCPTDDNRNTYYVHISKIL